MNYVDETYMRRRKWLNNGVNKREKLEHLKQRRNNLDTNDREYKSKLESIDRRIQKLERDIIAHDREILDAWKSVDIMDKIFKCMYMDGMKSHEVAKRLNISEDLARRLNALIIHNIKMPNE